DELAYLGDIRDSSHHILEALLISFLVRHKYYARVRAGKVFDSLGHFQNGHFLVSADVVCLADSPRVLCEPHQRAHRILNVGEAAPWRAVAVYGYVLARQRLPYKTRNHHAVSSCLPRPNGIEQPRDAGGYSLLFPVGDREKFVYSFRAGIAPPTLAGRAHHQVVVLPERNPIELSVYL